MSAERTALMGLIAAERELADAVARLEGYEGTPVSERFACLMRALKLLREGAKGYGLTMGMRGLERAARIERASEAGGPSLPPAA